ncbi:MAG: virulence protein [Lachnospiraceae bacterium]|nr:virulence protein [Lachnospiraceae bacterium]
MELNYNVTGDERKALVKAISGITGEKAVYKRMPTCAYEIGAFTVSKEGALSFEDSAYDAARNLIDRLQEQGYKPETQETTGETEQDEGTADAPDEESGAADEADEAATGEQEDGTGLSISIPDDFSDAEFENLQRLAASKQTLMKAAFGSDGIGISREEGKVTFSGFTASDGDHTAAYMQFITLLARMARTAKRVTARDHDTENRKYAFRCFLLRIGMIGPDYKKSRRILLENLTGSSAFRDGKRKEAEA